MMLFLFEIGHPVSVHRIQQDPKFNMYNWDVNFSFLKMQLACIRDYRGSVVSLAGNSKLLGYCTYTVYHKLVSTDTF